VKRQTPFWHTTSCRITILVIISTIISLFSSLINIIFIYNPFEFVKILHLKMLKLFHIFHTFLNFQKLYKYILMGLLIFLLQFHYQIYSIILSNQYYWVFAFYFCCQFILVFLVLISLCSFFLNKYFGPRKFKYVAILSLL
jgi:hypothetical protein